MTNNNYEKILKQGLDYVTKKNFQEAKNCFTILIDLKKDRYEGYLNLSNLLVLENKAIQANELMYKFLKKNQAHPEIVNGIAINLFNSEDFIKLDAHINIYINIFDNYLLNYLKGYCLNRSNLTSKSEFFLNKSISLNQTFWPSYELLLNLYNQRSKLIEMNDLINKASFHFKKNIFVSYFFALYLFRKSEFKKSFEIISNKEMQIFFENHKNQSYLADYFDLLGKNFEKQGNFNYSLKFSLRRNQILLNLNKNKKFKKEDLLETINIYKKFFSKNSSHLFESTHKGLDHKNLVFLIGFPRSGTTLLDTILRTHSQSLVLEEKPYLLKIRHDFFKSQSLNDLILLDKKNKIKIQEKYFESFNYTPNKTIIDKFPLNLLELGFIKTVFPDSKIVLAIRHPLDSILSCVLTAFKMNEAMINFENLTTTSNFYNESFGLMLKYIDYYKIKMHNIKYENVVSDFENEIKNLLFFLNLKFENSLKEFYKTAKKREKIHTPSYSQVIQPLYSSSINKHLNYYNDMKIIIPKIEKWIKYFSYQLPLR